MKLACSYLFLSYKMNYFLCYIRDGFSSNSAFLLRCISIGNRIQNVLTENQQLITLKLSHFDSIHINKITFLLLCLSISIKSTATKRPLVVKFCVNIISLDTSQVY